MRLNKKEIARQLIHLSGILTIFITLFIGKIRTGFLTLIFAGIIFFFATYIEAKNDIRKKLPFRIRHIEAAEDQFHDFIKFMLRGEKEKYFTGALVYLVGLSIALFAFPENIALVSIIALAVGDSFSTIIGIHFGKHKLPFNRKKSIEGSLAFFTSTFLSSLLFVSPLFALIGSITGTLVEVAELKINDNILIPVVVGLLLVAISKFI